MKFTINALKTNGCLTNNFFKKLYGWDYVKYDIIDDNEAISAYRNNNRIRSFTLEEFAMLVVYTDCIENWYEYCSSEYENVFNADDIYNIIEVLYKYSKTCGSSENFEQVIDFAKNILVKHNFEYYRPEIDTEFNVNEHDAIGVTKNSFLAENHITQVYCGGLKHIISGKVYKFSKVYIAK
ncbi:MAG: hypothetical protein IKO36_06720 [Bacteroidaceae bacterium]|nr:hypothetical protein [Bacteroidaceae bacterium]